MKAGRMILVATALVSCGDRFPADRASCATHTSRDACQLCCAALPLGESFTLTKTVVFSRNLDGVQSGIELAERGLTSVEVSTAVFDWFLRDPTSALSVPTIQAAVGGSVPVVDSESARWYAMWVLHKAPHNVEEPWIQYWRPRLRGQVLSAVGPDGCGCFVPIPTRSGETAPTRDSSSRDTPRD